MEVPASEEDNGSEYRGPQKERWRVTEHKQRDCKKTVERTTISINRSIP
jgi:hypothetical protein